MRASSVCALWKESSCVGGPRSRPFQRLPLLTLSGCAKSSNNNSSSGGSPSSSDGLDCKTLEGSGPKVGVAYDVGGRGDQSFNDSAVRGLEKAVKDLDATCIEAKAHPTRPIRPRGPAGNLAERATTRSSLSASCTAWPPTVAADYPRSTSR